MHYAIIEIYTLKLQFVLFYIFHFESAYCLCSVACSVCAAGGGGTGARCSLSVLCVESVSSDIHPMN